MKPGIIAFAAVLIIAVSSSALAGWTVTNLHPSGSMGSEAMGISGGRPVGYVRTSDGRSRAAVWSQSGASFVNLHPADYMSSTAHGAWGSRRAGTVMLINEQRGGIQAQAVAWNGAADDYTILNSPGSTESGASAIWGDQIAGFASESSASTLYSYAGWWPNGADSWVNLTPAGWSADSKAMAIYSGWQAGYVARSMNRQHAALWHGTASSWVDLHPAGYAMSQAMGIYGGRQVGFVVASMGGFPQPVLWRGTAATMEILTPAGYTGGRANAVWGDFQVGSASTATGDHAGVWRETADSWEDLHDLLGAGYTGSEAKSIERAGEELWIVGTAYKGYGAEAVMWHYTPDPVPEPGGLLALGSGLLGLTGLVPRKRIR